MDGVVVIILLVVLGFGFVGIYNFLEARRKREYFIRRLKKEYGSIPDAEYSAERYNALHGYFNEHERTLNSIDDISFHDIDGERLFKRINYCYSSTGEEYLYYLLRTLQLDRSLEEWKKWDEKVNSIDADEAARIEMQVAFAKLGRTGKYSIFQYIRWLDLVEEKPFFHFLLLWGMYIVSVVVTFLIPPLGIWLLVGSALYGIYSKLKQRKAVEPYLVSVEYLVRTLSFVDINAKKKQFDKIWGEDFDRLTSLRKKVKNISGFNMWMMQKNSGSDPLIEAVKEFFNGITHADLVIFYQIARTIKKERDVIYELLTLMGRMEAEISVASFRKSLPFYATPDFSREEGIAMEDGIHPLLEDAIPNSFDITKGMLLTGSNASGKSTFLKMVEVSAILAQTIYTVPAKVYAAKRFRVFSSMSLKDDLENHDSYYMVEIKAIKRIMDASADKTYPLLVFVDEVLRGTNTVERIAAASEIMRSFSGDNMFAFAATHDLELTKILEDVFVNYHFEEVVTENDIFFPYRILEGPAHTRNAIKLLALMGYPEAMIASADAIAKELLAKQNNL